MLSATSSEGTWIALLNSWPQVQFSQLLQVVVVVVGYHSYTHIPSYGRQSGRANSLTILRAISAANPPPGPVLLCFLGEVQGSLSQVLHGEANRASSALVTSGPALLTATGGELQNRQGIISTPMTSHWRQVLGPTLLSCHSQDWLTCIPSH